MNRSTIALTTLASLLVLTVSTAYSQSPDRPQANPGQAGLRVQTMNGVQEGVADSGNIRCFKGIPFAQPPIGALRWREPQPVKNWKGVRKANEFGPRPMQRAHYKDMVFRSKKISEDCLYLNVWAPQLPPQPAPASGQATSVQALPVLVYFYGGGFYTGDGSELRYDGASMARKGIIMVTVNYRLGIFGFFSHPDLTAASPHQASGNYGHLDQCAALHWVHENISAFGGDPGRVTIAGQSAGSMSVSALMASPLSRGLFAGAIGESSSILWVTPMNTLVETQQNGARLARALGANTVEDLRAIPADQLLEATARMGTSFSTIVDGYFLPRAPIEIYSAGLQTAVPLLAGWNSAEIPWFGMLGKGEATPENYRAALQNLFGPLAGEVARLYAATTREEVMNAATNLSTDRFGGYSTWKWLSLHAKTSDKPVYRYLYTHPLPHLNEPPDRVTTGLAAPFYAGGAPHSAEIAYALGNLPVYNVYQWTPEDFQVSAIMQGYFVNFIKTGNPNGPGLPHWSDLQSDSPQVMLIDADPRQEPIKDQKRFLFLDALYYK